MPAKILFRDAQGRDGVVDLRGEPVWVGRAMECAIRTDDAMVSRKHSMIRFDQGRYWVEDLGSSNGTHVNDVKVQRQALNHNDVVRCGSLWLRYVEDGGAFAGGSPGMGGAMGQTPGPRTQLVNPPAGPTDFGFQSTVATPARPATQGIPQGGMMPGTQSYGGGRSVVVDMPDAGEVARYRQMADDLRAQLRVGAQRARQGGRREQAAARRELEPLVAARGLEDAEQGDRGGHRRPQARRRGAAPRQPADQGSRQQAGHAARRDAGGPRVAHAAAAARQRGRRQDQGGDRSVQASSRSSSRA